MAEGLAGACRSLRFRPQSPRRIPAQLVPPPRMGFGAEGAPGQQPDDPGDPGDDVGGDRRKQGAVDPLLRAKGETPRPGCAPLV